MNSQQFLTAKLRFAFNLIKFKTQKQSLANCVWNRNFTTFQFRTTHSWTLALIMKFILVAVFSTLILYSCSPKPKNLNEQFFISAQNLLLKIRLQSFGSEVNQTYSDSNQRLLSQYNLTFNSNLAHQSIIGGVIVDSVFLNTFDVKRIEYFIYSDSSMQVSFYYDYGYGWDEVIFTDREEIKKFYDSTLREEFKQIRNNWYRYTRYISGKGRFHSFG